MQEQPKSRQEPSVGDCVLVRGFEDYGPAEIKHHTNNLAYVKWGNGKRGYFLAEDLIFPYPAPSIRDEA